MFPGVSPGLVAQHLSSRPAEDSTTARRLSDLLPLVVVNAELIQQTPDQRPVDIPSVRIGDSELARALSHHRMTFAGEGPLPSACPQSPDHLAVANRLGHTPAAD